MIIVTIKQNDTKLTFHDVPKIDDVPLQPSDVIGCTLKFILRNIDTNVPVISQTAVINADASFSYSPVTGDVDIAGTYQQEWQLTYSNGKVLTFPNNTYNLVQILPELA